MAANEKVTIELLTAKNVSAQLESLSYKPKLSNIIEETKLKYQEFRIKYLTNILKTTLSRIVKILIKNRTDIIGFHRLPLGRNSTNDNKRVFNLLNL